MIKKIFMVSTIVVLVLLVIITPRLISQEPQISEFPRILIDHMKYELIIDVHSAVEPYRYKNISITVLGLDNDSYRPPTLLEEETFNLHLKISKNDTYNFQLNVTLFDQNFNGFDYNATIKIINNLEGDKMLVYKSKDSRPSSTNVGNQFRDILDSRG